jgi:hypothetical protein
VYAKYTRRNFEESGPPIDGSTCTRLGLVVITE